MNTIENKLNAYRAEAERFSGYDGEGYDSYEGEMSSFDDYGAGSDQNYMNAAGQSAAEASQPYIISIQNTTVGTNLTATIFGWNDNTGATNFGNNVGLVFTDVIRATTFTRLFNQSMSAPFKIGRFRFQSSSATQLTQSVSVNYVDSNGNALTKIIPLSQMQSVFQQQSGITDVVFPVTIDANTYMTISIIAATTLTISMYPDVRITNKASLNGAGGQSRARITNPNGNGSAPVVIQTGSPVKALRG